MTKCHHRLRQWYQKYGRTDLPWRVNPTPYNVYVSEIMLQQTQVATVKQRFYEPFLQQFPSLSKLAAAKEHEVMKAWEGLGYYRRARYLHKAAKQIGSDKLPDTLEALLALPGIGRNTAHAILAFGFEKPYPVMEANLKRVLCRYYGLVEPSETELWQKADQLLDKQYPFEYNQAMMDIGAMVCTVNSPSCLVCPLNQACVGKLDPAAYKVKKTSKKPPTKNRIIIVKQNSQHQIYLKQRDGEFLGGLWGFEQFEVADIDTLVYLGDVKQTYSHFALKAKVYKQYHEDAKKGYYSYQQASAMPLSKLDQKILSLVEKH